jgi:hypothetical protein
MLMLRVGKDAGVLAGVSRVRCGAGAEVGNKDMAVWEK